MKRKKYNKKGPVFFFFFYLMPMDDLNHLRWLKTHYIISLIFFFIYFLMLIAGKWLILLKSRKKEHFGYSKRKHIRFSEFWVDLPLELVHQILSGVNLDWDFPLFFFSNTFFLFLSETPLSYQYRTFFSSSLFLHEKYTPKKKN